MKISDNGLNIIKEFEGLRLYAYQDSIGVWTIGWGHTKTAKKGMIITLEVAKQLLADDVSSFESAVNKLPYTFTQNEFDALVSFAFNCGVGNLLKLVGLGITISEFYRYSIQELNKITNKRTKPQIADAILKYDKAGGKPLAGLTRRRKMERKLFIGE